LCQCLYILGSGGDGTTGDIRAFATLSRIVRRYNEMLRNRLTCVGTGASLSASPSLSAASECSEG
jgi:hypothetical protein